MPESGSGDGSSSPAVQVERVRLDLGAQTATFDFGQQLSGRGTLHVEWEQELNDSLAGFYRSKCVRQGDPRSMEAADSHGVPFPWVSRLSIPD